MSEETSSNPFPWVRIIEMPNGGHVRIQIDQGEFRDIPLTAESAMRLCVDAAMVAVRCLKS